MSRSATPLLKQLHQSFHSGMDTGRSKVEEFETRYAESFDSALLENFVPSLIEMRVVLFAIDLDANGGFGAIEVKDVFANWNLSSKCKSQSLFAADFPKYSLADTHLASEVSSEVALWLVSVF